jgi:benzaldehyde dehydrogenase (NAD)
MSIADNALAPRAVWSGKIFTDRWQMSAGGTQQVFEKATGAVLGEVGLAAKDDVAAAAIIAKRAQRLWAGMPGPHRGDILRAFSGILIEHANIVAEWIVRETGSIGMKGRWEVHTGAREVQEVSAIASQPMGHILATEVAGRTSMARRVPIGVVAAITPWNSPFLLALRAIAPALATGNAVLLKPDPQTPICGGVLLAAMFEKAGLPAGLLQILPGGPDTGQALVADPNVDMVSFTGSVRAGRQVGAVAGEHLKRVSLELGGNNAFIVLEDADLDAASSAGAWGAFFHQGQICLTAGRHIVHRSIADNYVDLLVKRAERLIIGDPANAETQIGPIINERQAANVDRIISESVAKGAVLRTGGTREGLYFKPTVLAGVEPGMAAFDEEIFGPVAPIIIVDTDEEAVELANRTEYGLVAAVASADQARALRIADALETGIVHVNDQTVLHEVYGPIGGVKASGNGFSYSMVTNAEQFTDWRWVTTRADMARYPC